MINIIHIVKGWFASKIYASKTAGELSMERLKRCEFCRYAKPSKVLKFINGDALEINTMKCSGCGCPVVEKSMVKDEKCPLKKWKQ